ncbi:MAG TPA: MFS transporter [Thermoplasmata archaeon]|nr:MFS transporter [Thermoplasmata archaeon]
MDRNLRILVIGAAFRALGLALLGPFLNLYLSNVLGIPYETIAVANVVVGIAPIFLSTAGGLIADRVGRRRLFVVSLAGEALAMTGMAALMQSGSFVGVVVAFGALAVVGTTGGPGLSAYIADIAHGSARSVAFTWLRVGHNAGFAAGVFAGGALIGLFGFVPVAIGAAAIAAGGVGFIGLTLDPSPYDVQLARAAAPGASRSGAPGSLRQTLRVLAHDRSFLAFCLFSAVGNLTLVQWGFAMPLFVQQRLHLPYAVLGAGYALNGLMVVFLQNVTTRGLVGHRHTTAYALSLLLYVVGFIVLAAGGLVATAAVALFVAFVVIATVGENVGSVPWATLPSNLAPPTELGAYNGAYQTIIIVGQLAGTLLGGWALATIGSPIVFWLVLAAPAVPAAAGTVWLGRWIRAGADRV